MLPGLRFLFAAIVLWTSVLIFGLGAAALLRAAHEEVANIPARRSPPEPVFAQAKDSYAKEKLPTEPPPTLAMLRVEPPVAETPEKAPDSAETSPAPIAPTADASAPAEPEQVAAVKPDEPASTEAPAVEAAPVAAPPAADTPTPEAPPAAAQTDAPAPAMEASAPAEEAKPAAVVAEAPPANDATPSAPEAPATPEAPAAAEASPAATKIATLGGPAVTVEEKTSAKRADAKPDQTAAKKRARAERARERRRLAQQQRPVRPVIPQQQYDVFGQPIMMRPTR
jgi:hypothetical protein